MDRYIRNASPQASYSRYITNRGKFKYYLIFLGVFIAFWLYLSAQGVRYELLSRSAETQTITAYADRNTHDCDKSDCYYEAYGHYTINGKGEEDVKLGKFAYPIHGEVGIRVNPSQPRLAMDLYRTSYAAAIVVPGIIALTFAVWGCLLFWQFRQRGKKVTQALARKSA